MVFGADFRNSLILAFLVAIATTSLASAPLKSDRPNAFQNITRTIDKIETEPTFLNLSNRLLFLQSDENYAELSPWDNRIVIFDLESQNAQFVSEFGVFTYRVADDESSVQLLRVTAKTEFDFWDDIEFSEIRNWEISKLDLKTFDEEVVEESNSRSLSEGLQFLGHQNIVFGDRESFVFNSPGNSNRIAIQRQQVEDRDYWLFSRPDFEDELIFITEVWNAYGHSYWTPRVLWLDESTFVTLGFKSDPNAELIQGSGEFSIVRINLNEGNHDELYSSRYINPFTEFAFNSYGAKLYFHLYDSSIGRTEILSLDLNRYDANSVYGVFGEVAGLKLAKDGMKMAFTLLLENNSDIIRLDLQNESQLKFAGN